MHIINITHMMIFVVVVFKLILVSQGCVGIVVGGLCVWIFFFYVYGVRGLTFIISVVLMGGRAENKRNINV